MTLNVFVNYTLYLLSNTYIAYSSVFWSTCEVFNLEPSIVLPFLWCSILQYHFPFICYSWRDVVVVSLFLVFVFCSWPFCLYYKLAIQLQLSFGIYAPGSPISLRVILILFIALDSRPTKNMYLFLMYYDYFKIWEITAIILLAC